MPPPCTHPPAHPPCTSLFASVPLAAAALQVFYGGFNVYRSFVDPRAKFGDAVFVFGAWPEGFPNCVLLAEGEAGERCQGRLAGWEP